MVADGQKSVLNTAGPESEDTKLYRHGGRGVKMSYLDWASLISTSVAGGGGSEVGKMEKLFMYTKSQGRGVGDYSAGGPQAWKDLDM